MPNSRYPPERSASQHCDKGTATSDGGRPPRIAAASVSVRL